MHLEKRRPAALAIMLVILIGAPVAAMAQQGPAKQARGENVMPLAPANPLTRLLPDSLGGIKAVSDIKHVVRDNLQDLAADQAAVYREYLVTSAASRDYAGFRVEVFETENQFAAFGLFTFSTGASKNRSVEEGPGSGAARVDAGLVFWKGNFFVRVVDKGHQPARGSSAVHEAPARAVADAIVPRSTAVTHPPLLDSLPAASILPESKRYFLGPESLNVYLEHAREAFVFEGDTEAVMACYSQGAVPDPQSEHHAAAAGSAAEIDLLKLVIIECHTPQFATDAMARVTGYVSSLPEAEQSRIIVRRVGNYVVEAANVGDREFAEGLIATVEYPYTVKWLRNPLWPTNDPFRAQKAAEMLLSTFGLLGLILMTVLVAGSVFGTTIFLKRRKRQQEMFSDAGGMLRLDIDQFESVILGLPPKRDN